MEKKSLGSEASSYSMKESSSSKAEARPNRRRERAKEEEENMVEMKGETESSFSTSCVVGGASHTEMSRLLELQEKVQPCMQPGKWFRRAQFTSRSSFPPCHGCQ